MRPLELRILESRHARFGQGVSEDIVRDAESVLGVQFPLSYRWWLLRYGSGYLGTYELQGLAPELPSKRDPAEVFAGDVVWTTLQNRARGLPDHLLELLSYEGDEVYFLDLAAGQQEAPVVMRSAGNGDVHRVANSFAEFLSQELSEASTGGHTAP